MNGCAGFVKTTNGDDAIIFGLITIRAHPLAPMLKETLWWSLIAIVESFTILGILAPSAYSLEAETNAIMYHISSSLNPDWSCATRSYVFSTATSGSQSIACFNSLRSDSLQSRRPQTELRLSSWSCSRC